jgi:hypothetical protein
LLFQPFVFSDPAPPGPNVIKLFCPEFTKFF